MIYNRKDPPKPKKNKAAVALGALGGQARARNLTEKQRSAIARKAGRAGGRGRPKADA